MIDYASKSAIISACGFYRYTLERHWGRASREWPRPVLWIMLNPSTADASEDDNTIGRCAGFADSWGYTGILVANLYAYRATDPRELKKAADPIGPENYRYLHELSGRAALTVAGWGGYRVQPDHIAAALKAVNGPIYCLGRTKMGMPKHPLYLSGLTQREVFNV